MKKILAISVCLLSAVSVLRAQSVSALFLDVNADVKALSTAGSSAAVATDGAFLLRNNAASSSVSDKRFAVGASYGLWMPNSTAASAMSLAATSRLGKRLGVAVDVNYFTYKPVEISNPEGVYTGSLTPNDMSVSAGLSYRIVGGLSAGVNLRWLRSEVGAPKAGTAFAADFGVLYRLKAFRAGLNLLNLGSKLDFGGSSRYSLPSRLDLAAGYRLGANAKHSLDITAAAAMCLPDSAMSVSAGLRYAFNSLFWLAGGYRLALSDKLPSFAGFGAGLSVFGIELGAAYVLFPSDSALMFNLSYSF